MSRKQGKENDNDPNKILVNQAGPDSKATYAISAQKMLLTNPAGKPTEETTSASGSERSKLEDSKAAEDITCLKKTTSAVKINGSVGAPLTTSTEERSKNKVVGISEVEQEDDEELVLDLGKEDADDPLMVSEYVCEIFEYLRELEITTMANPNYMENQGELEWKIRGVLVDWLLEVHTRFCLLPETLFLAVNIIDRFLSCKIVQLDQLQLVGVTAMFIASKYEEVRYPHVRNFRYVVGDGFTEEEILTAERFILAALSLIAAAAMNLARLICGRDSWDATLAHYAGYTEEQIQPVFQHMIDYLTGPVIHEAFHKKYSKKRFGKASIAIRGWVKELRGAKYDKTKPMK